MGANPNPRNVMIEFEKWDFEKGFFVVVQVRYTMENWWAVLGLRNVRAIKLVTK
jgi:hypothetical protein